MKGRTIVLDHFGDIEAAALIVDGKLDDLLIDSEGPRPGTIYRAIADRPVKGQGDVFENARRLCVSASDQGARTRATHSCAGIRLF